MVRKNAIILVIIGIVLGSLGTIVNLTDLSGTKNNVSNEYLVFDDYLTEFSMKANKNLPKMIDSKVRFDSMVVLPNKTLQSNYTFIAFSKDELNIDEVKRKFLPVLLNEVKTNQNLKLLKDNKVTMVYLFNDKNGSEILKLLFDYNDYK